LLRDRDVLLRSTLVTGTGIISAGLPPLQERMASAIAKDAAATRRGKMCFLMANPFGLGVLKTITQIKSIVKPFYVNDKTAGPGP
jgi:hypothetical protein